MSKHHHQSKTERIYNKAHGVSPFHYERESFEAGESMSSTDVRAKGADDSSIQLRAYEIYNEKGGHALDDWLEAERILKDSDPANSSFISEGNPNTQK